MFKGRKTRSFSQWPYPPSMMLTANKEGTVTKSDLEITLLSRNPLILIFLYCSLFLYSVNSLVTRLIVCEQWSLFSTLILIYTLLDNQNLNIRMTVSYRNFKWSPLFYLQSMAPRMLHIWTSFIAFKQHSTQTWNPLRFLHLPQFQFLLDSVITCFFPLLIPV